MKHRIAVLLASLALCSMVQAQGVRILEFNGGYFNAKDVGGGLIFGGSYGISVDERVDLSLGLAYFHKSYVKETAVADTDFVSGIHEKWVMKELEYSTHLLPLMANVNIRFPFQPPLYWYIGASASYQFLFNTENNFGAGIKEKRNYRGFGWIARAGIEYTIGSRSSVILEAIYNSAKLIGSEEKKEGLPIWNEVNVSGLGFRAGLKVEFF